MIEEKMIEEIKEKDNKFSEAKFYTKVDHIFIMILTAIMERDMSSVKHYLSDSIYNRFNELVESYKNDQVIRLFDEMNVASTYIIDYYVNKYGLNIVVKLVSRYMDYFVDENGNFVSGHNEYRIEEPHHITFTKALNTKELGEIIRCPGCGHSLNINETGLCSFCGQTIDMKDYDYIITEIDEI